LHSLSVRIAVMDDTVGLPGAATIGTGAADHLTRAGVLASLQMPC
jgi:hypothetical protein